MIMGGKSATTRADNNKARKKLARSGIMREFFEDRAAQERNPLQNEERICQKCSFKARYPFVRCPECNEVQK